MKINGMMLGSDQPKVLGEFYTKIFGTPGWQQDDWYGFQTGDAGLMIGGHSEVHGVNKEPARIMITLIDKDVKAAFEKIKGIEGANVVAEPYLPDSSNPDMWLATLSDPDGNYIQISPPWDEQA